MSKSQDPVFVEFSEICHKLGLRVTSPRLVVYRHIRGNQTHPIVDEIWEATQKDLPNISRESVYRILTSFAEKGLIYQLERSDVVARYDSNPLRHDHFFCERCGRIFDFNAEEIDPIVRKTATPIGQINRVEARVLGVCQDCLSKEEALGSHLAETSKD